MLLNPQKALEDFNQVIRLDPSSGDGYAGRGIAYGILSNQKKATEDIQKAMTIYEQQGKTEEIKKFKENFSQFLEI
jgi:Tfp pilus assembly protein PilF